MMKKKALMVMAILLAAGLMLPACKKSESEETGKKLGAAVRGAADDVKQGASKVAGDVKDAGKGAWEGAKDFGKGVKEGLKGQ